MNMKQPEWFVLTEELTPQIMQAVADLASSNQMRIQFKHIPVLAHWYMCDSLLLANQANLDGMHANALSLTRQCLESLNVIEIGICGHKEAEAILTKWNADDITPGKLRQWLQTNVWHSYGVGIWNEPYSTFMREFASALQPYAHYGTKLAQWQMRSIPGSMNKKSDGGISAVLEMRPRAYDSQKASRITLFHAILTYVLGRICIPRLPENSPLIYLINQLGKAIAQSRYLDGHSTDWGQQFWAMLWSDDGNTLLE